MAFATIRIARIQRYNSALPMLAMVELRWLRLGQCA
jgi:hypothetical protein